MKVARMKEAINISSTYCLKIAYLEYMTRITCKAKDKGSYAFNHFCAKKCKQLHRIAERDE